MRLRRGWSPDKQGLISAVVGLVAAVAGTALPLASVAGIVLALVKFDKSGLDTFHDDLLDGIKRWAARNGALLEPLDGLRSGWESSFLTELQALGASSLLGSDPRTRERVEDALARTAFQPLIPNDIGRTASRKAARQLAEDLPALLVEAAPAESGLAAALTIVQSGLDKILGKLDPLPADQALCEAYLNVVIDELDRDPWTAWAGGEESSLTSVAVALSVTAWADSGYGPPAEPGQTGEALELAARCDRLVLLGGPGAGKTWLARRIVIDAAESALGELMVKTDPAAVEIPVFARCADVLAGDKPPWEAVVAAALARMGHRFGSDELTAALRRRFLMPGGRFLVILDGLDEADELLGGDALSRLAATAGRDLRIVLTGRPAGWRRQLRLDKDNDRHRIARLRPLRYPQDVLAVVDGWLADRPEARAALVSRLADSPELARAVQTPLLCAMHCLMAGSDEGLPAAGWELWTRVVRRLIEGLWHSQYLNDQQRLAAAKALRELAWAGAGEEEVTGLSAWPPAIQYLFEPALPEKVESAVSRVAPAEPYGPDSADAREFLHPSIREHLVAEYVAALPPPEAQAVIEPHLWFDVRWETVLPAAIAAHGKRRLLLDAVISGGDGPDLSAALGRRDGFGELRRLLGRLATETAPGMWSAGQKLLIDDACRTLRAAGHELNWRAAASRGWSGAGPGPGEPPEPLGESELTALLDTYWHWDDAEIRERAAGLPPDPAVRQQVIQALVHDVSTGHTAGGVYTRHLPAKAAIFLDALDPPPELRAAAVSQLLSRMRSAMDPDDVSALRTLSDAPVPDDLPGAALDQLLEPGDIAFMDSSDYRHFDHRALELATVLDLLGADDAVRRAALDRILAHLAGIAEPDTTVSKVAEAIAVLRPAPEHRAAALALLFRRLAGSMEGWRRRLLLENISQLLPSPPDVGPVLLLLSDSGPWPGTGDTGALLARLCAGAPEEDQQAAAARIVHRMESAADPQAWRWAEQLPVLAPSARQREAAVRVLWRRLPPTLASGYWGNLLTAMRELQPADDQRRDIVGYLAHHIGLEDSSADLRLQLGKMAAWFAPAGEARSAIAAAVLAATPLAKATLDTKWNLRDIARTLTLTEEERRELAGQLIPRLSTDDGYGAADLGGLIAELGPDGDQRARAADALVARLQRTAGEAPYLLVAALSRLDAPSDWRAPATAVVVNLLASARPYHDYVSWAPLLPDLAVSEDDGWRIAEELMRHLVPDTDQLSAKLALLDELRPSRPGRLAAIADCLARLVASESISESLEIARFLRAWPLTPDQRDATAQTLADRVSTCESRELPQLLRALAALSLTSTQRSDVTAQAIRRLPGETAAGEIADALLALGGLTDAARDQVLDVLLGRIVSKSLGADENMMARLLRLGFDGAALARATQALDRDPQSQSLLRTLARALRHATSLDAWKAALARVAAS